MAADIPEKEPTEITAGDTAKWTKSLTDYKASDSWVLAYVIIGQNGRYTVSTTASGDNYAATVLAVTTAVWAAGDYAVRGYVTKSTEQYTIYEGSLKVKPNLVTATGVYDNRTHVKKVLDAIEAIIEGRATKEHDSIQISGRSITLLKPEELIRWRSFYKTEYVRELAAEKIARGEATGRRILTRFSG